MYEDDVTQFENRKKVYLVMNKFERDVDDFDDIGKTSLSYFRTKSIPDIEFYELWEILNRFDIIPNKTGFKSAHLSETGAYVEAISRYRDMYHNNNKDKYYRP